MENNVIQVNAQEKMQQSYLDYAMSVITDRAIPNIKDGMKPVHRRIVYAMHDLGLFPEKEYKKSARVVGEVLGKYHVHGDQSIYGAVVRMAQEFNMRYPLVDGHGNWGSIDGDPPAAFRYSECKLTPIAMELLKDLNKNTVDFVPNFDGEEIEPTVLPSFFPQLLCNGVEGIAVGVSTSIPSHNLSEVIDGTIHLIDNPKCYIEDIMKHINAPDFATGGIIVNPNELLKAYETGNGRVIIRCKHHFEKNNSKDVIVVTEIPYQVNKSKLISDIALLTKDRIIEKKENGKIKEEVIKAKIPQIDIIKDESDREGIRIVFELKKGADKDLTMQMLFKYSELQKSYSINMLALVNQKPEQLNLKQIIMYYVEHLKDITLRKTKFDLDKAEIRAHILIGLVKALDNMDSIIKIVRNSKSSNEAKEELINKFEFTEKQAEAILDLKLQKLTSLEKEKINKEYKETLNIINKCKEILENKSKLVYVIKQELLSLKEKFGDSRRTEIIQLESESVTKNKIKVEKQIEDYSIRLYLTKDGWLKKTLRHSDQQKIKDGDIIIQNIQGSNKDDILFFSNKGNCYKTKAHQINECTPSSLGEYLPNILKLDSDENILYVTTTNDYTGNMLFIFENGKIAKVEMKSYYTVQNVKKLTKSINVESKIVEILHIEEDIELVLVSSIGKVLIINTNQVGAKSKRDSQGVNCMKSKDGSVLEKCYTIEEIVGNGMSNNSVEYYRGNIGAVGNFMKKEDKKYFA